MSESTQLYNAIELDDAGTVAELLAQGTVSIEEVADYIATNWSDAPDIVGMLLQLPEGYQSLLDLLVGGHVSLLVLGLHHPAIFQALVVPLLLNDPMYLSQHYAFLLSQIDTDENAQLFHLLEENNVVLPQTVVQAMRTTILRLVDPSVQFDFLAPLEQYSQWLYYNHPD